MRSISLTLCAATVVAATLIPATAASADSSSGSGTGSDSRGTLSVTPSSAAPDGAVALRLDSCGGKEAKGTSDVFASEARFTSATDGGLIANARIRSDAAPGDYDIQIVCADDKGTKVTGRVTVIDRAQATPLAPVRAGGGGTAAADDQGSRSDGPGATHAVIGVVLAALAVASVGFRNTRRRRPAGD
ncbi:hypothetical protein AB0L71_23010 [Streptomyces sp. NPDC052052]|uniref:hypothetical protein n=1 Tax=Streptomyces sp. NPDC052052 TaxID=3154756 RepID=UPI00343DA9D5